jgi:predicted nicotinamide N-methyase
MYRPARGNVLPAYFYAMLDDADRSIRYHRAITACLADVRRMSREPIVVVDVGVGTGLLSACALVAGADLVVGVDVNAAAVAAARRAVREACGEAGAARFVGVVLPCPARRADDLRATIARALRRARLATAREAAERPLLFDVVVSELLGTLVFGEDAQGHLAPYLALAREHGCRLHAVPERCAQTLAVYDVDVPASLHAAVRGALAELARDRAYAATDSRGLGVPLVAQPPPRRVGAAQPFYEVSYTRARAQRVAHPRARVELGGAPPAGWLRLAVCEWTSVLWQDVVLSNTLAECRRIADELGPRYALARQEAWGFMVCDAADAVEVCARYSARDGMTLDLVLAPTRASLALTGVAEGGACPHVAFAADAALARDLAAAVAAEQRRAVRTGGAFGVVIVNDVTCGALCVELARRRVPNVRVAYTPEWLRSHQATARVVDRLGLDVACETTQQRKRARHLEGAIRCAPWECLVLPELFYMTTDADRATRAAFYARMVAGSPRAMPTLDDANATTRYDCDLPDAPPWFPSELLRILAAVGTRRQLQANPRAGASTRELPVLAFARSEAVAPTAIALDVTEVRAADPGIAACAARLSSLQRLIAADDLASAAARMLGGSGLLVRAAPPLPVAAAQTQPEQAVHRRREARPGEQDVARPGAGVEGHGVRRARLVGAEHAGAQDEQRVGEAGSERAAQLRQRVHGEPAEPRRARRPVHEDRKGQRRRRDGDERPTDAPRSRGHDDGAQPPQEDGRADG